MKKLMITKIIALAIAVGSTLSFAAGVDETYADRAKSIADGTAKYYGNPSFNSSYLETNEVLAAKIDNILANGKTIVDTDWANQTKFFPKTTVKYFQSLKKTYPIYAAYKLGEINEPTKTDKKYIKFAVEREAYYAQYDQTEERMGVNPKRDPNKINQLAVDIQSSSIYIVRRWLRRNGKSFVTQVKKDADGKETKFNPTQEYMDEITKCLNAPRFDGLIEALKKFGVLDEDLPNLDLFGITKEKIEEYKSKILDGEIEFSPGRAYVLRFELGTEGYNKFVSLYNNGVED